MLLPGIVSLYPMLFLASCAEGRGWSINVTTRHQAKVGSSLKIPCMFTYPARSGDIIVTWKKRGESACSGIDREKGAFVFNPNITCVDKDHRGRTSIIGDQTKGNCTLLITNVTKKDEIGLYVRVFTQEDTYSFFSKRVSIKVIDGIAVTVNPNVRTFPTLVIITQYTKVPQTGGKLSPTSLYMSIFLPVGALVILVVGVLFHLKRKRSQTLIRENSGYYANVSRAPADVQNREIFCNVRDAKFNQQEANDEPVYANVEAPTAENTKNMDISENLYGNVDYFNG